MKVDMTARNLNWAVASECCIERQRHLLSGAPKHHMETLLTPDELIAILKVPKSWLYGRIHAGTLPFRYC